MTNRKTLDHMTSDDLDQLHAELDALRAVARGYCPACGRGDAAPTLNDWQTQRDRAEKAEATLARVHHLEALLWESDDQRQMPASAVSHAIANDLRAALDQPKEGRPMAKQTLPDGRRAELAAWLTSNNIDPHDVLIDSDLTIIDTDSGRAIRYEAAVRDTTGRLQVDDRGDRVATEMRTVPLQTEAPNWWQPYVKPTRNQLLDVVEKVRVLHQPTGVVAAAEYGNPPDCSTCGPSCWPCPTIRALDSLEQPRV